MPRKGPDLRTSRHNPNNPDIYGPPEHAITEPGQHSFDRGTLSDPNPIPPPVSLDIAGKIGQTVFQHTIPWISGTEHGIQKMLQRRRHVMPFDPRTHLQLLCRCRFAAAVAGWHLLTTDEKREYNRKGNARSDRIEGLNVWIRQFIAEHDLEEYQLEAILRQARATIPFQPYPLIGLTPSQEAAKLMANQYQIGGATLIDPTTIRTLVGRILNTAENNLSSTLRLSGATSGYQVPAGKILRLHHLLLANDLANVGIVIGYGDNDVGLSSANPPTNAVPLSSPVMPFYGTLNAATLDKAEPFTLFLQIPAGKYPFIRALKGILTNIGCIILCEEVNAP